MSKKYRKGGRSTLAVPAPLKPVVPYLAAALFFLAVCLNSASSIKGAAVCFTLLALAMVFLRFSVLRERVTLPFVALMMVVLMDGISVFYADVGKYALQEFLMVLCAFCLTLILLAGVGGEGAAPGRKIASILERSAALASLVSIDFISTRLISTPVRAFLSLFTPDFESYSGVEVGVRMTSLFGNANVFAGWVGLGVLLSLGLVLSSQGNRERASHLVCLFINALGFVLAFSMGAIAMIALAFLAYLLLELRERRAALFLLMVETLILTLVAAALTAMTSLQAWSAIQPVPLLCAVLGAAALCLLDLFVGQRIADKLSKHGKTLLIIMIGAAAALAAFILAAYNLTGGIELQAGETLRRSVYPEPGAYTMTAQADGPVSVTVESQNQRDTMMHTSTVLYRGELSSASFTVPEDSQVVYFTFSGQDVYLESVSYEGDGGAGSVPLGYKLLPGFIANRIQGLFANENAIQRLVFFEDGMKLFRRSPLFGLGLGGFQNAISGVQSFYYVTRYAHNHYVQALAETGVIGLILFVGLIVLSAAAVLLTRRKEKDDAHPLTPALGAALVFMAGHGAVEVVFSCFEYLPTAFGVFALISLCCGSALPAPWLMKKVKSGILLGYSALLVGFLVLLGGNMIAFNIATKNPSFDTMQQAINLDKFEWADYMLSYVTNTPGAADDMEIMTQADEYAARLAELDSNSIPIYLAEYYMWTGRQEQGIQMVVKYVDYVSANSEAWQTAFDLLEAYEVDAEYYHAGVAQVAQMLEDWNKENLGKIVLDEGAQAFLERLGI